MGSKEGQGPKSAASTYAGAGDKTKVGRYKTLAQHRAAVAANKAKAAKGAATSGAGAAAVKSATDKAGSRMSKALASVKAMKKEDVDELDMVVQYLVSEGIAQSLESALTVVEGLSDEFINSILEQCYLGSAMVEHLLQTEEAATVEEANYIISELDEENLNLLIQSIMEGEANVRTIKALERKIQAGGGFGAAHRAPAGKQSLGAAYYKAVQRGRV